MRSFIAIDLDKLLIDKVADIQKELSKIGKMKFVHQENLHFTLKFLGDIPEAGVMKVKEELKIIAEQTPEFEIKIKGIRVFPNEKFIRIIWLDIEHGKEEMKKLFDKVNGIKIGKESNTCHLTIARVKKINDKNMLIKKLRHLSEKEIGQMTVNQIKLKKSTLTPEGPIYEDLATFKLMGNERGI